MIAPRLCALLAAIALGGCASFELPSLGSLFGNPATPVPPNRGVPWGTAPGAAAAAAAQDPSYRIGAEDGLDISVWKEDALKSTVIVRPDGGISFPLAGDIPVAGKTAAEVREELVRRLSRFVPEPEVTVSVVRVASYRIFVIGRVNKPGDFTVGRTIDVLQALSLAGGMTPFASEDGIRIIRREDGTSSSIPFEYSRIRKGGDLSQNITLKSGDVLLVP